MPRDEAVAEDAIKTMELMATSYDVWKHCVAENTAVKIGVTSVDVGWEGDIQTITHLNR
jgi:hypothetical protein